MINSFKKKKDEFKNRLIDFINKNEMNPVFINNWNGELEILFSAHKYRYRLLSLIDNRVHNMIDFISKDMQKEISVIFDSIYNR